MPQSSQECTFQQIPPSSDHAAFRGTAKSPRATRLCRPQLAGGYLSKVGLDSMGGSSLGTKEEAGKGSAFQSVSTDVRTVLKNINNEKSKLQLGEASENSFS